MPIRRLAYISICTTLICVLTYLYLPTPWGVPLTGQTLAVLVAGLVLNPWDAVLAVGLYLIMGLIGLPVFSGAQSGVGILLGPTGGYLSSFLLGIYLLSWFSYKKKPFLGILSFTLIVYIIGSLQLSIVTSITFSHALKIGMLPFIPGDLIKAVIANLVSKRVTLLINKESKKHISS